MIFVIAGDSGMTFLAGGVQAGEAAVTPPGFPDGVPDARGFPARLQRWAMVAIGCRHLHPVVL
jgi:hypothetical protein